MFTAEGLADDLFLEGDGSILGRRAAPDAQGARTFRCALSQEPIRRSTIISFTCLSPSPSGWYQLGVATRQHNCNAFLRGPAGWGYEAHGGLSSDNAVPRRFTKASANFTDYGPSLYSASGVLMMLVDPDEGTVRYAWNGQDLGLAYKGLQGKSLHVAVCVEKIGCQILVQEELGKCHGGDLASILSIFGSFRIVRNLRTFGDVNISRARDKLKTIQGILGPMVSIRKQSIEAWGSLMTSQNDIKELLQPMPGCVSSGSTASSLAHAVDERDQKRKTCFSTLQDLNSIPVADIDDIRSQLLFLLEEVTSIIAEYSVACEKLELCGFIARDSPENHSARLESLPSTESLTQSTDASAEKVRMLFHKISQLIECDAEQEQVFDCNAVSVELMFSAGVLNYQMRQEANAFVHKICLDKVYDSLKNEVQDSLVDVKYIQEACESAHQQASCLEPWLDKSPTTDELNALIMRQRRCESTYLRAKADVVDMEIEVQMNCSEAEPQLAAAKARQVDAQRSLQQVQRQQLQEVTRLLQIQAAHFPELKVPTSAVIKANICPVFTEARRLDMFEDIQPLSQSNHGRHTILRAMFDGEACVLKEFPLTDAQHLRAFHREVKMQYRLRHTSCVPVDAAFVDQHKGYIQMPFFKQDLNAWMAEKSRLPEELLFVACELLHAVSFLHQCHIVHGDLKLSNFLMDVDGSPRLADFEHAFSTQDTSASTSESVNLLKQVGTLEHMAPELHNGACSPTPQSDCYSLGVLLQKLFTSGDQPPAVTGFLEGALEVARELCSVDPTQRPAASDAVRRPSFKQTKARPVIVPAFWVIRSINEVACHRYPSEFMRERLGNALIETSHTEWPECERVRLLKVSRVERIENMPLWKGYVRHREGIAVGPEDIPMLQPPIRSSEILDQGTNEVYLFHGTTPEKAEEICRHGFDPAVAKLSSFYGAGSYFCENACKAFQYSSKHPGDQCCVLYCRVTLGFPHYADRVYQTQELQRAVRRAPPRAGPKSKPCDSIVVNPGPKAKVSGRTHEQVHREFVVFDRHQAYPEFIAWLEVP